MFLLLNLYFPIECFQVNINESRPLRFVKAPPIRSGNEISKYENHALDPKVTITHIDDATAQVLFEPSSERQKELAHKLGTNEKEGLAGQFVVQYDVARDPNGGEVDRIFLPITKLYS